MNFDTKNIAWRLSRGTWTELGTVLRVHANNNSNLLRDSISDLSSQNLRDWKFLLQKSCIQMFSATVHIKENGQDDGRSMSIPRGSSLCMHIDLFANHSKWFKMFDQQNFVSTLDISHEEWMRLMRMPVGSSNSEAISLFVSILD